MGSKYTLAALTLSLYYIICREVEIYIFNAFSKEPKFVKGNK